MYNGDRFESFTSLYPPAIDDDDWNRFANNQ